MSKKQKRSRPAKSRSTSPARKINPLKQRKDGRPLSPAVAARRRQADSARRSQAAYRGLEKRRGKLLPLRTGIYGTYRDYEVDSLDRVGAPIAYEAGRKGRKVGTVTISGLDAQGVRHWRRLYAFDPDTIEPDDDGNIPTLEGELDILAEGGAVGSQAEKSSAIQVDKVIVTFRMQDHDKTAGTRKKK